MSGFDPTPSAPAGPRQRVLVVDDEREIADLVAVYLRNAGFEPLTCYDGDAAWEVIANEPPDLAVIDVMLPGVSGFELCERARAQAGGTFPIIILTAKIDEDDRIRGLAAGADDYVTKPFLPLELVARVKAQLRRSTLYNRSADGDVPTQDGAGQGVLTVGGITLDIRTREVSMNGKPVMLTPTEFDVLRILCENRGSAVSAKDLYRQVWGEEGYSASSSSIAVHIRHLREKLGDSFEKPKYIKTVWGCGYKID